MKKILFALLLATLCFSASAQSTSNYRIYESIGLRSIKFSSSEQNWVYQDDMRPCSISFSVGGGRIVADDEAQSVYTIKGEPTMKKFQDGASLIAWDGYDEKYINVVVKFYKDSLGRLFLDIYYTGRGFGYSYRVNQQ